jgi:1,4-alpha-glucan branching enzyme
MPQGFQCIVLHAHLPYVRHPEYDSFFEENWLFEAITETYLPLILALERQREAGVRECLTLSLSPTLLTMLRDPFLQARYLAHMDKLRRLAQREVIRTRGEPAFAPLAKLYQDRLEEAVEVFEKRHACDLVAAFAQLQAEGVLELITTAATHGYLPLMKTEPAAVRAQLLVGAQTFQAMLGVPAKGVWLPECGYYPGLEGLLEDAGYSYFFVDSHGILNATPRPYYGLSAPLACPNGVAAFGRDPESSRLVWSRDEGYPGDYHYRDFYRDIGFDLDFEYIKPFILDGHTRIHTGFKYYRVTGPTEHKLHYDPAAAEERVAAHAADFVARSRRNVADQGARSGGPPPLIVSPYDAELFGHWWFEGTQWLEAVIQRMAEQPETVALTTPSAYLARHRSLQAATPSASSWGDGGYNAFWLNPGNDWIYPLLHDAGRRMNALVRQHADAAPGSPTYRALQQAGRSLLLAQASDWAFIMKTGTAKDYAFRRTKDYMARFNYLEHCVRNAAIDERRLQALEVMDQIFPSLDPAVFS